MEFRGRGVTSMYTGDFTEDSRLKVFRKGKFNDLFKPLGIGMLKMASTSICSLSQNI